MRFRARSLPHPGGCVVLKRSLGLVAVLLTTAAVAGFYSAPDNSPPAAAEEPKPAPADAPKRAAPAKDADSFGYTAAFDAELKKVGQISPQQFAERYPAPKSLGKLSFDPTDAKFFDQVNV